MRPASRREHEGFMYVEVLVAVAILGLALISIAPMFFTAARENAASADLTFAAMLAHEKGESLKALGFAALTEGTSEEVLKMRSINYKRSWQVEVDQPHPGMKTVTVTVEPLRQVDYGGNRSAKVSFYRVP